MRLIRPVVQSSGTVSSFHQISSTIRYSILYALSPALFHISPVIASIPGALWPLNASIAFLIFVIDGRYLYLVRLRLCVIHVLRFCEDISEAAQSSFQYLLLVSYQFTFRSSYKFVSYILDAFYLLIKFSGHFEQPFLFYGF